MDEQALDDLIEDARRYRYLRDRAGNDIMRKLMDECRPEEWNSLVDEDRRKTGNSNG